MEPTDLYNKSKRNLIVFAALLALVLLEGLQAGSKTQILGFDIQPQMLPTALSCVVLWLIYQFYLARAFQNDEVQKNTWTDYWLTALFGIVVLTGYVGLYVLRQLLGLDPIVIVLIFVAVVSSTILGWIFAKASDLAKWRREALSFREATIEARLKEPGWILNYNPKSVGREKPISFLDEGKIGDGRNDNESAWRLEENKLVLLDSAGKPHNTFDYDPALDQFKSSGATTKHKISGQYIYRKERPANARAAMRGQNAVGNSPSF